MSTVNLTSADDDGTFNYVSTALNPVTVNVTTTTAVIPTVTINASLVSGAFNVNATAGATADVNEVIDTLGTFNLTANGGNITANTGIGVAASNNILIEGGGTFTAGSTFLGVLDDAVITFGADTVNTDTLVIDSGGSLLDLSITAGIGGFTSSHEVINDKLIAGADVATYSITQTGVGQPQTLAFFNASAQNLGSLTFTAGTFSGAQLGSHAMGTGPLLLATAADGTLKAEQAACYVAGTHIQTDRGEVAVEDLRIGDLAITASGQKRPIVWLGNRRIDIARHLEPAAVQPVRVSAGAFGEGLPHRDLWLSPGHNVASEGALMPICCLINGRSVVQIEQEAVEYWHVELDAHDIILAEGLLAESYLDTGNRSAFVNGGAFIEAHPDFLPKHWAETCLPLVWEGPAVAAAKARLSAQLVEKNYAINHKADAHIIADGSRIEPTRLSETRLRFVLPDGSRDIALRSNKFVPAHIEMGSPDVRELGLCVRRLEIDGRILALDDKAHENGWREAEFNDRGFSHRWTTGATPLPTGTKVVIADLVEIGTHWTQSNQDRALIAA